MKEEDSIKDNLKINPNEEIIVTLINFIENYRLTDNLSKYRIYYVNNFGLIIEATSFSNHIDLAYKIRVDFYSRNGISIEWNYWDDFCKNRSVNRLLIYERIY